MFLNTAAIIAREVIESATIACLLMVLVRIRQLHIGAIAAGIASGIIFASLYGSLLSVITPLFNFRGQEIIGVSVNGVMFSLMLILVTRLSPAHAEQNLHPLIFIATALLASLSLTLEISEIGIYVRAYEVADDHFLAALLGACIGVVIGLSLAVLAYFALLQLQPGTAFLAVVCALALLGGGLLSQSLQLLGQVDLLPEQKPLWDSSGIVAETSMIGQLLVALFRYESRPTALQVAAYSSGALAILMLGLSARRTLSFKPH